MRHLLFIQIHLDLKTVNLSLDGTVISMLVEYEPFTECNTQVNSAIHIAVPKVIKFSTVP